MKRITAVIMLIVLLGCVTAIAEESDPILSNLKEYNMAYKLSPGSFDEEKMMMAYVLLNLYYDMQSIQLFQSSSTLKQYGSSLGDVTKQLFKGHEDFMKPVIESMEKWLNGEMTEDECKDIVMTFVDITIQNEDLVNSK